MIAGARFRLSPWCPGVRGAVSISEITSGRLLTPSDGVSKSSVVGGALAGPDFTLARITGPMTKLTTTLHVFSFDTKTPEGRDAWKAFEAERQGFPHCHGPVLSDVFSSFRALDGQAVELDTGADDRNLFNNQWNTTCGKRVFDYALQSDCAPHAAPMSAPHGIRRGHWLEQTAEMRDIRRNINACGYCGHKEPAARGLVFCDRCRDSAYLTEKDLHLTRMCSVDEYGIGAKSRPPLTQAEREHLLPLFINAKIHGDTERGKARIAKERAELTSRRDKAIATANTEHDGKLWLMDRGFSTANVIYYAHTDRFSFGWQTPLSEAEISALLQVSSEFPFSYDLICADGRKLSGN